MNLSSVMNSPPGGKGGSVSSRWQVLDDDDCACDYGTNCLFKRSSRLDKCDARKDCECRNVFHAKCKSSTAAAQQQLPEIGREHGDSFCTHTRRAGLVSAAVASAQGTTGTEAQKPVSYVQVTSMATVATGASKDVVTSLLLSELQVCKWCDVVVACCVCVCMFVTPLTEFTP